MIGALQRVRRGFARGGGSDSAPIVLPSMPSYPGMPTMSDELWRRYVKEGSDERDSHPPAGSLRYPPALGYVGDPAAMGAGAGYSGGLPARDIEDAASLGSGAGYAGGLPPVDVDDAASLGSGTGYAEGLPPAEGGALARSGAGSGGPPPTEPPPVGAVTRAQQDPKKTQQMSDLNNAINVLQAARGGMNGSNLPLLAAAGALLSPTRTGGFAESLGAAFNAAVPVADAQRKLEANALIHQQQMQDTAEWRKAQIGVAQTRAGAYASRTAGLMAKDAAQAALADARAAALANPKMTTADVKTMAFRAAYNNLIGKPNPDTGEPWTETEAQSAAWDHVNALDIKRQNSETALGNLSERVHHNLTTESQTAQRDADNKEKADDAARIREQVRTDKVTAAEKVAVNAANNHDLSEAGKLVNSAAILGKKLDWNVALKQVRAGRAGLDTPSVATGRTTAPAAVPAAPVSGAGTVTEPYTFKSREDAMAAGLKAGTVFKIADDPMKYTAR